MEVNQRSAPTERPEIPDSPEGFIELAREGKKGWSQEFGGFEGVARHTLGLQENLKDQAAQLAMIRAAAIQQMLVSESLAQVAAKLGVSKQAVSKAARPSHAGPEIWTVKQW